MTRAVPARAETIQIEGGIAISGEFTGSETSLPPSPILAAGPEIYFTTTSSPSTPPIPTETDDRPISPEITFRTLPLPACEGDDCLITGIGEEGTFTTPPAGGQTDTPPGNGSNGGGGGGGSGGGSGSRLPVVPLSQNIVPGECPVYLTKFIRLGGDNDPVEVLKLQRFLRDFERMDVPATGVYGEETFEAVKIFQLRYAAAVLNPWGIDYPTGYVYITTTLAINNLHCERDPATDLDLRYRLPSPSDVGQEEGTVIPAPVPGDSLPEVGARRPRWQIAALGMFDFIRNHPWWWLTLVLVLIIAFLLFEIRRLGKKLKLEDDFKKRDESPGSH